jgi:hypothetical protein
MRLYRLLIALAVVAVAAAACARLTKDVDTNPAVKAQQGRESFGDESRSNAMRMYDEGQRVFRDDTFGSEAFWGDTLKLHLAILGEKQGGVGPGISPKDALKLGLKVDQGRMPKAAIEMIKKESLSLEKPETTVALLKANAVIGITGKFDKNGKLTGIGIQCALCHSTVDDSFSPGTCTRTRAPGGTSRTGTRMSRIHRCRVREHSSIPDSTVPISIRSAQRTIWDICGTTRIS